jgi:hypothetical protein
MLEIRLYPCRRKRFSTATLKDRHAEFFYLSQKVADFAGFAARSRMIEAPTPVHTKPGE